MTEAADVQADFKDEADEAEETASEDAAPPTDPSQRSLAELETQITKLAGHLNAASYRWLVLIAEFDRREGWNDGSTPSCAHWLGWKCGIDSGAAREKVRVARSLEELPLISASMKRGALSYSKVRALTRVATAENENTLLTIALQSTAHQVETLVRLYRRADEACELGREAMQHANRSVIWYYDDDGSLVLRARLPAEGGALLVKALDAAAEALPHSPAVANAVTDTVADTPAEAPEVPDTDEIAVGPDLPQAPYIPEMADPPSTLFQRRADALALFAETWLSRGYRSLDDDRQQIVVHVDSETLRDTTPGRCEIEGGPAIAVETARRLSCDSNLISIFEDRSGQPLDVGRKTRSIPSAIRRALRSRDSTCRFPGCTHTRFLDGHHITHWADGGETKLSNLLMLCRFHHRQVHEGRVDIQVLEDGALRFSGARGQHFVAVESMNGDADQLASRHRSEGIDIDSMTAVNGGCSKGIHYGIAVEGLLARKGRKEQGRRDVPAGTSAAHTEDDPT